MGLSLGLGTGLSLGLGVGLSLGLGTELNFGLGLNWIEFKAKSILLSAKLTLL